jgi:putative methyltransferase (TIGR04325 family)
MPEAEAAARARRRAGRLVPSAVRPWLSRALRAAGAPRWALPEWEYVRGGWAEARGDPDIAGWKGSEVVDAYRAKRPGFLELLDGTGPLAAGTSPALPNDLLTVDEHNAIVSFGYVVACAARKRDSLSILDWGGGVGLHYHLARALVPGLAIDYSCKELPPVAALGRELLPSATFYEDESCFERRYDFVMASSSLQYEERWQATLGRLAEASAAYLFLTRVPVVERAPSFVLVQRPYTAGLDAEYLSWAFNRRELADCASRAGLRLVREFLLGFRPDVVGAPEQDETRAFLFARGGTV